MEFAAKDEPLRDDVGQLGRLVGEVLREQGGAGLFEAVEDCRRAAIERRESDDEARRRAEDRLARRVSELEPTLATELVRSFSVYFRLINLAEKVHRIRRRRDYLRSHQDPQSMSLAAAITDLAGLGWSRDRILELLAEVRIEPVFTAHPTESTRRTLLEKEQEIARLLVDRLDPSLTPPESRALWERLRMIVSTLWQTEEHPSSRPTVGDEREQILFFLSDVVQRVLPPFYESLTTALQLAPGASSEPDQISEQLIRFGSWVGGDMDGNPNVGADTILDTLQRHRALVLRRYHAEARRLSEQLTQTTPRIRVSEALTERLATWTAEDPQTWQAIHPRHRNMPYRVFFTLVAEKLERAHDGAGGGYRNADQLLLDLDFAADSLAHHQGRHAGLFNVLRFRSRVRALGFHLASLDLRQDALVHRRAIAELLRDREWLERSATERTQRLLAWLDHPDVPADGQDCSPETEATLEVFRALAEVWERFGPAAIHTFIVSMTQGADDVLSVLVLARWAGLPGPGEIPLHVSPLLETVPDLQAGPRIVDELLTAPVYRRHVATRGHRQPIMIGYSDSNKEGGIAASRWSIHRAQEQLVAALGEFGVAPIFFHGRGGSISRGGGKTHRAVLAAPPGAIAGRLRVTEQGETINAKYGLRGIALRTLEQMTASVLTATARDRVGTPAPSPESREAMDLVASASRATYRSLIWDTPGLAHYFRHATPIDVIERLALGSRPAKRSGRGPGIGGLRAIPWVFAWTQSRHILPGWFGLGSGLTAAAERYGLDAVRQMIDQLPVVQTLLDGVEMVLAKTDLDIAARYAALAGRDGVEIFDQIRAEHDRTRRWILDLAGTAELLDRDPTLQRSIRLRNPYVDPMSFLQVELLQRWRQTDRTDDSLLESLRDTVTGIAEGLQNTG